MFLNVPWKSLTMPVRIIKARARSFAPMKNTCTRAANFTLTQFTIVIMARNDRKKAVVFWSVLFHEYYTKFGWHGKWERNRPTSHIAYKLPRMWESDGIIHSLISYGLTKILLEFQFSNQYNKVQPHTCTAVLISIMWAFNYIRNANKNNRSPKSFQKHLHYLNI